MKNEKIILKKGGERITGDPIKVFVVSSRNRLCLEQQITCVEEPRGLEARGTGGDAKGPGSGQQPGGPRGPPTSGVR